MTRTNGAAQSRINRSVLSTNSQMQVSCSAESSSMYVPIDFMTLIDVVFTAFGSRQAPWALPPVTFFIDALSLHACVPCLRSG
jgi:hypothetical protein